MLAVSVADTSSRRVLVTYRLPVSFLEPFEQYFVDLYSVFSYAQSTIFLNECTYLHICTVCVRCSCNSNVFRLHCTAAQHQRRRPPVRESRAEAESRAGDATEVHCSRGSLDHLFSFLFFFVCLSLPFFLFLISIPYISLYCATRRQRFCGCAGRCMCQWRRLWRWRVLCPTTTRIRMHTSVLKSDCDKIESE